MAFEAPEACTLPTAERPLRVAEFDALFATALRRVDRISDRHARLHLTGPADLDATVRDLTAREVGCCSFFDFTVGGTGNAVILDVEVPAAYVDVLDALLAMARS
jgi:hypothetical protein